MDLVQTFELSWLQQSASLAQPVGLQSTMLPAIIMAAVVIWAFLFSHLRTQLKFLPHLNFIALIAVIGSFQACGQKSSSAPQQLTGVSPSVPSAADDLGNYASGTTTTPGYQNIRIFNPRQANQGRNTRVRNYLENLANANPTAGIIWGYKSSNVQKSVAAECLNYNALLGKTVTYDPGSDTRRPGACEYIRTWEDFPGDDTYPPSIGVKRVLNECRGSAGKLVLDLNVGLSNVDAEVPKLRVKNATPFPVYAFCIRENNGGNPTVQLLNPETLSYEFVNDPNNNFSNVTSFQGFAGWFVGAFNDYDGNGRISSLSTTIRLVQNQGTNQQQGAAQALVAPLPAVKVIVVPEGANAAMAEYKMMTTLTDAVQEPIRGSPRVGIVNPANGEVAFEHADLIYSIPETALSLSLVRSYKSFNNEIGDFGYNWSWIPSKEFYSFATPMGDMGDYSFYRTDDGRLVSRETGPFWNDDEENPLRPDPEKNFFMWGLENSLFDLAGRLISLYDGSTGNRLYYLRHGSSVALIADQMAARSSLRTIVTAMQAGTVSYNPNNPSPTNIDREAIRNALLRVPGNFLYIVRNNKNYIQAVIDKSGNFTWYYYGPADGSVSGSGASGDHLVRVVRYVTQDSMVTGSQQDSMILYNYAYTGEESFGKTFSGLIQRITTWDRDEAFAENIVYSRNPRRFGAQPQVESLTMGGLEYELSYDYENVEATENPSYTTTLIDWKGEDSATHYVMNPTGQIIRTEGPTESSNREILSENKWDPKLLRVSNEITRGVETVYDWDQETGFLRSSTICADRNESGNRLNAVITDAGCTDSSLVRTTNYAPWFQVAWIDEWFKDISGELELLDNRPPYTPLYSGNRDIMTEQIGCFGGKGTVNNAGQLKGTVCNYTSDSNGGNRLSFSTTDQFEDGSTRSTLTVTPAARFNGTGNPTYWVPTAMGVFNNVNQTGFEINSPAAGANSVFDPVSGGMQSLSGNTTSYRGIYGEVLSAKHPWGAETRTYYDYRTPVPKAIGTKVIGLVPTSSRGGIFESAAGLTGMMTVLGVTMELGERPRPAELEVEARRAFGVQSYSPGPPPVFSDTAEPVTRFFSSLILDSKVRPQVEFTKDGTKITRSYLPGGAIDWMTQEVRKNSTNTSTISLTTDYQYDAASRRNKKTVYSDGSTSEFIFRPQFDKGVQKAISDKTSLGGLKTESEVTEFDWFGRPLESATRITSGTTSAATQTTVQFHYSPFGELKSRVTTSGGAVTTETAEIDSASGVLTSSTTSTSGTNLDNTSFNTIYSNFDSKLTARTVLEEPKNIQTSISGTPGKNQTTTVTGPASFEQGSPTERVYSEVTEKYDGCGNLVTKENNAGSQVFGEEWDIAYGDGLCKVKKYYPHTVFQPTPPPGPERFSTRYGYMNDGSAFLTNEFYQGAVGPEGSVSFSNQFVSDCARDPQGRCTIPGRIYSFETSGRSHGLNFFIEYAQSTLTASNTMLLRKNFVSDRITTELGTITSPTSTSMSYGSLGNSTFSSTLNTRVSSQSKTSGGNYSETITLDPGFGIPTREQKSRTNPVTNTVENSILNQTLDQHGRVTNTTFTGGGISRTSNLTQWQAGVPKETVTTTSFASGVNEIHTIRHEAMTHDVPMQTSYLRTSGGTSFGGNQNFVRDGLGRPTRTVYTQDAPAALNSYSLTHTRDVTYDNASRIVSETSDLQETLTGSTTQYDMGTYQFARTPRENMIGGFQPLTVNTEYMQSGVKMNYAGFQVEYFLGQGPGREGRILRVVATDPQGQTHTYTIDGGVTSSAPTANDRYIGLQDRTAGRMTYVDDDRPWWDFIGITSNPPPVVRVNNIESPTSVVPWTTPFSPSESSCSNCAIPVDRRYNISLTNSLPTGIDGRDYPRNSLLNRAATFPRTSATPSATVCDYGGTNSRVGALSTVFDEQRRLSYGERTIVKGSIEGIQGTYKLQVFNAYDAFGLPALREQVISFRSSQSGNAYSGANYLPVQVVQNMRLNAAAPEGIQFPQRALTLVEYEQRGVAGRARTTELTRTGTTWTPMVYVWGPSGPIFSFARAGASWERRDFIYDQMGNIKGTRCNQENGYECEHEPRQNEAYLPYLTSIVSEYQGPMTYQNHGGGEFHVSGTYSGYPLQTVVHNYSWEPQIQPLVSRFGGMGADRDILGILYTNGTSYNSMNGEYLSPENFNDSKVCDESVAGISSAQAVVDAALGRNASTESTMTRSTSEAAKALFVQNSYFQNAPWWFYFSPGLLAVGLYYSHEINGTGWYFKDQALKLGPIGWQAYGAMKAIDFLCLGDYMRATPGTLMDYWGQAQIGLCVADVVTLGATAIPRQVAVQGGKIAAKSALKTVAKEVGGELIEKAMRPTVALGKFGDDVMKHIGELENVLDNVAEQATRVGTSVDGLPSYMLRHGDEITLVDFVRVGSTHFESTAKGLNKIKINVLQHESDEWAAIFLHEFAGHGFNRALPWGKHTVRAFRNGAPKNPVRYRAAMALDEAGAQAVWGGMHTKDFRSFWRTANRLVAEGRISRAQLRRQVEGMFKNLDTLGYKEMTGHMRQLGPNGESVMKLVPELRGQIVDEAVWWLSLPLR